MTVPEAAQQIMEKVSPTLFELGVESFVMFSVMTDGDGNQVRVVIGKKGQDAAWVGHMAPVIRVAREWERGAI